MAATRIPQTFGGEGQSPAISIDSVDFTTGKAIVKLYGGSSYSSRAVIASQASGAHYNYVLSNTTFYSENVVTYIRTDGGIPSSNSILASKNFDARFKKPIQIEGDVVINIPVGMRKDPAGSGETKNIYLREYLIKYDGATETQIASGATTLLSSTADSSNVTSVRLNIPRSKIKTGETLRLRVELYGWNGSAGGSEGDFYGFGHDPMNRNDANTVIADAVDTNMFVLLPLVQI